MKVWQWVVLCVFSFVVFLIANAPATLIYRFIPEQVNVSIVQPSGTLFNGKMTSLGYSGILLDDFSWELSPLSLLLGKASLNINGGKLRDAQHAYADGNLTINLFNPKQISAEDLTVLVPIKSLLAQVRLPVRISAQGRIRADLTELDVELEKQCNLLSGRGNWNNASIELNQQSITLGNFDADLSCENGGFAAQVGGENKFNLDAKFVLTADGKLAQSGTFLLDPSLPQAMRQAAVFFGNADSNGRYTLR